MSETVSNVMGRVAAIYARVSSERQREEGTVQSQLAGLRELAGERGLIVAEELEFCDEELYAIGRFEFDRSVRLPLGRKRP